jgi:hypothetical protein
MLTLNTSSNAKNSSNVQEFNNHSVDITLAHAYHWLYYIQTRHLFLTLSFNLQLRLKHERGSKLESVWDSSTLLQVWKSESQHSQMNFHLESWNPIVFQGLQPFPWKSLHQNPYIKIHMWKLKAHNIPFNWQFSKLTFKNSKNVCHFHVVLPPSTMYVMGTKVLTFPLGYDESYECVFWVI